MRRAILGAVAFLAMGETATATDGNLLLDQCQAVQRIMEHRASGVDAINAGLCRGFVMGAMDTLTMHKVLCPPDSMDGQQIVDIVSLWLRQHPETRHLTAAALIKLALKEKFPCN